MAFRGALCQAARCLFYSFWGFPKIGVPFWWGSCNTDYGIWRYIRGTPVFGKMPFSCLSSLKVALCKRVPYPLSIRGPFKASQRVSVLEEVFLGPLPKPFKSKPSALDRVVDPTPPNPKPETLSPEP